jgi:hypothetical protein
MSPSSGLFLFWGGLKSAICILPESGEFSFLILMRQGQFWGPSYFFVTY